MKPELETFYELVEELEVAMMTTRRADGHLESRAMATQKRSSGADLWFVAAEGTGKLAQIEADPHVNLAYYKDRTREWVSVSGLATLSRDRDKMRELYGKLQEKSPIRLQWFLEGRGRNELIAVFLGMLELVRLGGIALQQSDNFGEILIGRTEQEVSEETFALFDSA